MQLVIAEKPSVARDLARVLGVRGAGKHAIEGARRVITWCIGHLVELEEPAAYDARWKAWRLDTLPMLPATFKLRPVPGTRDQLRAVRELLRDRRFTEVVNACDAGREGELIFRYVYELAGSRLPIRRLWISSLTDEAIRAGFAACGRAPSFDALADAARCRSEADWLVGMNATRAVTVSSRVAAPRPRAPQPRVAEPGRRAQSDSPLYSIGRVQTPTLAILVRREQEIRAFGRATTGRCAASSRPPARRRGDREGHGHLGRHAAGRQGGPLAPGRARARRRRSSRATSAHGAAARPHGPVVERLRQKTRARAAAAAVRPDLAAADGQPPLRPLARPRRSRPRRRSTSGTRSSPTRAPTRATSRRDVAEELPKLFAALAAAARLRAVRRAAAGDAARALAPRVRRRQGARPPRDHPDGQARSTSTSCRATSGASSIWSRGGSSARSTPTPSSRSPRS